MATQIYKVAYFVDQPTAATQILDLIDEVILLSGSSVLDIGSGTGLYARFFCDRGATVTAIDFVESWNSFNDKMSKVTNCHVTSHTANFLKWETTNVFDMVFVNWIMM